MIVRFKGVYRPLSRARGLLVWIAALAAGCSTSDTGSAPPIETVPVHGKVSVAGKPVAGGIITLEPLVDGGSTTQAVGEVKADGSFEVVSAGGKAGAMPGKYRVKLESDAATPKKQRGPGQEITTEVVAGKELDISIP